MFAAILSAVLPAVAGSLLRPKQKAPVQTGTQTVQNEVDYVRLRKNAEAAGFNPLTALRAGGAAGFTRTHAPIFGAPEVNPVRQGIANALQLGLQAAFDYDPLREEKSQLETQIMRAQLQRLNLGNLESTTRLGGPPSSEAPLGAPAEPEPGVATVTSPHVWTGVNPHLPDAEMWEQRYGDLMQEIGGGINLIGDFVYNAPAWGKYAYNSLRDEVSRENAILSRDLRTVVDWARPYWRSVEPTPLVKFYENRRPN